jgi:membrane fusion protein, multidrug efflux system
MTIFRYINSCIISKGKNMTYQPTKNSVMLKEKEQYQSQINPAAVQEIPWFMAKRAKITGAIVLFISCSCFVIWFFGFRPYISTDDARIAATIVKVANRGAGGLIQNVNVAEGSVVSQGTVLLEMDNRSARAQYDRAKARAEFTTLENKRMEELARQHGTSQQQLDKTRSDALSADADFRLASLALEFTSLRSPVNGIVIQKLADPGNILEGNQTAITVADIDHAWVSANIAETDVKNVSPGQKVTITVDEGGHLTGHVSEVRKSVASTFALIPSDNASGNFTKVVQRVPVKIEIDPHPGKILRVGQSVIVSIRTI